MIQIWFSTNSRGSLDPVLTQPADLCRTKFKTSVLRCTALCKWADSLAANVLVEHNLPMGLAVRLQVCIVNWKGPENGMVRPKTLDRIKETKPNVFTGDGLLQHAMSPREKDSSTHNRLFGCRSHHRGHQSCNSQPTCGTALHNPTSALGSGSGTVGAPVISCRSCSGRSWRLGRERTTQVHIKAR